MKRPGKLLSAVENVFIVICVVLIMTVDYWGAL